MIIITESNTQKIPGKTSLFIQFDYNADIINAIKTNTSVMNYDKETHVWEVPITCLHKLLGILNEIDDVTINFCDQVEEQNKEVILDINNFLTKPYDYQLDGIRYGETHDKWLLLDAPGLGKTIQAIYLAQELKEKQGLEHCFIICGLNTLKNNWKKEIHKHSDLSCRILGEKKLKNGKITIGSVQERVEQLKNKIDEFFVITNIETLRNNDIIKYMEHGQNKFDMLILDEAHTCKNPNSDQGKNLLKLKSAKYKIAMTGTLLLNSPLDAYVPLKWIGEEKSTYTTFKYYYCSYTGPFNNILLGYKNTNTLKDQLETCSLRRTKDLLNLPEKTVINEFIDMNPDQQKLYKNITDGIVDQVDKVNITTTSLLAMVARLRQATACPKMLTTENVSSAKIDRVCDLTEQIISSGNKVVVFSTFKETLNELMDRLKLFNPVLCTGDIKDSIISENIDKFQNDENCKVILATHQKMGTGITLTAASYGIFIDTPWTNGVYEQAQDRLHRIGSKKPVIIYNLICKDTIDERVLEIVQGKEAISDYVVDDKISQKSIDSLRKFIIELQDQDV